MGKQGLAPRKRDSTGLFRGSGRPKKDSKGHRLKNLGPHAGVKSGHVLCRGECGRFVVESYAEAACLLLKGVPGPGEAGPAGWACPECVDLPRLRSRYEQRIAEARRALGSRPRPVLLGACDELAACAAAVRMDPRACTPEGIAMRVPLPGGAEEAVRVGVRVLQHETDADERGFNAALCGYPAGGPGLRLPTLKIQPGVDVSVIVHRVGDTGLHDCDWTVLHAGAGSGWETRTLALAAVRDLVAETRGRAARDAGSCQQQRAGGAHGAVEVARPIPPLARPSFVPAPGPAARPAHFLPLAAGCLPLAKCCVLRAA